MKIRTDVFAAPFALLLAAMVLQTLPTLGQGTLTPPGAPGPTMLTLSQIEPRTPISGPFNINQPGSYYLTTNIVVVPAGSGITINANNVTLDLNGFTISSSSSTPAGYGIYIGVTTDVTNITIVNGFISSAGITNNNTGGFGGKGFDYGIYGGGANFLVKNVAVSGSLYDGINLTLGSSAVESCTVTTAGGAGIEAQSVSGSTAMNCGTYGIFSQTANNCTGAAYDFGIYTSTANNCYGQGTFNDGLYASFTATGCAGSSSNGYGLYAFTAINCFGSSGISYGVVGTTAENCVGESSSGTGIFVDIANNCYGTSNGGGYGVYASWVATGCFGSSTSGIGLDALIASLCHATGSTAFGVTHNVNSF